MTLSVFTNFQGDTITGIRDADFAKEAFQRGTENVGGVPQGPGGTTFFSGYSEAIGLDMNQGDPVTAFISCEDGDVRGVWTNGSATSIRDGITGSGFHDGLANGVVHPDMPMDTHPNDILLGFPGSGSDYLTNYRPFSEMNQGDPFSELDQGFSTENLDARLRSDNSFNCDDILLGHAATYRLKDVIITSFDNTDALTNEAPPLLQENCANGTFLQENCANGTFLQENCANGTFLTNNIGYSGAWW